MVDDLSETDMRSEPTGKFEGAIVLEGVSMAAQKFLQNDERIH